MKKWVVTGFLTVFILTAGICWYLYSSNVGRMESDERAAIDKAKQQFHVDQVESVTYYHGTDAYQVIKGVRDGRQMYFWVPDNTKKGRYMERAVNDGITRQEAIDALEDMDLDVHEVLDVRLGAINGDPVWEITFLNRQEKYNYVSVYFDNGSEAQRILNI